MLQVTTYTVIYFVFKFSKKCTYLQTNKTLTYAWTLRYSPSLHLREVRTLSRILKPQVVLLSSSILDSMFFLPIVTPIEKNNIGQNKNQSKLLSRAISY